MGHLHDEPARRSVTSNGMREGECFHMTDTLKERPNHAAYLEVLRRMTPEQRLTKAFELSEATRALFRQGLRERFP